MPQKPLQDFLDPLDVPREVKAQVWDAYHASKSSEDFQRAFKSLGISRENKAALWDMKFSTPSVSPPSEATILEHPEIKTPGRVPVTVGGPRYGLPGETGLLEGEFAKRAFTPVSAQLGGESFTSLYEKTLGASVSKDTVQWRRNLAGMVKVAAELADFAQSPAGVAALATGVAVPATAPYISAVFGAEAAVATPAAIQEYFDNPNPDTLEVALKTPAFAALMAAHAGKPLPIKKTPPIPYKAKPYDYRKAAKVGGEAPPREALPDLPKAEVVEFLREESQKLVSRRGSATTKVAREQLEARAEENKALARELTTDEVTQVSDIPSPNEFVPRKAKKGVPAKSKEALAKEVRLKEWEGLWRKWRAPNVSDKVKQETVAEPLFEKFKTYATAYLRKAYHKKASQFLIDEGVVEKAVALAMSKVKTKGFRGDARVHTWFHSIIQREAWNGRRIALKRSKELSIIEAPTEKFEVGTVAEAQVPVGEVRGELLQFVQTLERTLVEEGGTEALTQVREVAAAMDKSIAQESRLGMHEQNLRNAILAEKRKKAVAPIEIPPEEAPVTDIDLPLPSRAEMGTKRIDALVKKMERLGFGKAVREIQAALPTDVSVEFWTDNFRAALARYVELKAQQDPRALEHAKFAAAKRPGQRRREGGFITLGEMLPQRIKDFINKRAAAVEEKKAKLKARLDHIAELAMSGPTFYSHLERMVEARMPNRAAPEQVGGLVRKAGVTLAEAKWSGLDDLLALAKKEDRPVTKQEVLDTLRKNQITIEEVELQKQIADSIPSVEYSKYQLPGGENYKELLLKLPEREPQGAMAAETAQKAGVEFRQFERILEDKYPDFDPLDEIATKRFLSPEDLKTYEVLSERFNKAEDLVDIGGDFRGGHFEGESNILAHIRFNERTDVGGKRVLFIEEIQSDWAKAERRPAIAEDTPTTPFPKYWELSLKRMLRYAAEKGFDKLGWTTGGQQVQRYDLAKVLSTIEYKENPLKPGQYNVTPMDLNGNPIAQLDRVFSKEELAPTFGKEIAAAIVKGEGKGITAIEETGLDVATVEQRLDLTRLERNQRALTGYRELDVKGIEVGGKSLRALYDDIIPNFLNKYGKKWGARVESTKIGTDVRWEYHSSGGKSGLQKLVDDFVKEGLPRDDFNIVEVNALEHNYRLYRKSRTPDFESVHSIPITPEMKRSVLKGQRLMGGFGPTLRGKLNLGEKLKEAVSRLQNRQLPVVSKRYAEILQARKDAKGPTMRFAERLALLPREFVRRYYDRFVNIRFAEKAVEKAIGRKLSPETEAPYLEARLVFGGEGGPMEAAARRYGAATATVKRFGLMDNLTHYLDLFAYRRGIANVVRKRTNALMRAAEAKGKYDEVARLVNEGEITVKQGAAQLGRFKREAAKYRRQAKEFGVKLKKSEVVPKKYNLMIIGKELKDIEGSLSREQFAEVKKAAEAVWALNRKAWDLALKEGIISPEVHQVGLDLGPQYVPLWRIMEQAQSAGHFGDTNLQLRQQKILKAFKGSSLENLDPLENSLLQHIETIREAGRNRAARKLIQLREIDPEGFGLDVRELKFREKPGPGMGRISYFDNGKIRSFEVPKNLEQALTELNATDVGFIADTLLKLPKRWFQLGATQANLAFAIPNAARDIQRMSTISGARVTRPMDIATIGKDWAEALKSTLEKDEKYLEFLESRGAYSTLQKNISPETFLFERLSKNPAVYVVDKIEKLNNAFEEATKMTTYFRLRAQGMGVNEAAFETRRFGGSPDFASGGAYSRELNLLWMFFNANIQGTVGNIVRLATNPKLLGTMMATVTAQALILHKWNAQFLDDEGNPEWQHVPQYERDNYFVIIRPSRYQTSSGAIRHRRWGVAKAHVFRLLFNPIQDMLTQYSTGRMQVGKTALRAVSDLLPGQFDLEKHGIARGLAYGALSSANPAIRVPVELGGNISGFRGGAPIVPRAMEGIESREQFRYTTSEVAKRLGRLANISPIKIQYLVENAFGGLGQMGLDIADMALGRDFHPLPLEGDEAVARIPVIGRIARRFVGSTMDQSVQDMEQLFYTLGDKANEVRETFNWKKKKYAETPEVVISYLEDDPDKMLLYSMQPTFAKIRKQLSDLRKYREFAIMSKEMSLEDKREMLRELYKARVQILRVATQELIPMLQQQGQ